MSDRTKTIRSLCPLCDDQIPSLRIEEGQLLVKCDHRREYSYYTFEDYLQRIEEKKNVLCTYSRICKKHNEPFSAYCRGCDSSICDKCKEEHIENCYEESEESKKYLQPFKGLPNTLLQIEEHLQYLSELKDKYKDNEEIQIEYKKCIDRNSNIVKFVKILTDNYHFDNKIMYKNMYKLTLLNLYKPIDEKENTVLNYFKYFNFEQYKDCHSFKCEKYSFKIIHLKDGRIACYSDADIIEIFDIAKEKRDLIITIKDNSIKSVCQIDNGNLIIYTDKAFLIYSIGKDTYKCEGIIKIKDNSHNTVMHLDNNMIATYHYEIYLWNINDKPYSDKPFKVLNGHEAGIVDMLYITNQKKLISLDIQSCVMIWDLKTYQSIKAITFSTIEQIDNEEEIQTNTLLQLNEDTIVVGGEEHLFFVSIQTGLFRKKELCCGIGKTIEVKSIIKLRDNKLYYAQNNANWDIFCYITQKAIHLLEFRLHIHSGLNSY